MDNFRDEGSVTLPTSATTNQFYEFLKPPERTDAERIELLTQVVEKIAVALEEFLEAIKNVNERIDELELKS